MNAEELRFGPNSFDTVLMIEVLEHLPEPISALREAFRVAKKNVLISVPNTDVLPITSKYQVVPGIFWRQRM
jgi:ubiquinone/menaquinone biosynthesis C-methylase UbiE